MKRFIRDVWALALAAVVITMAVPAVAGWEVFAAQLEALGWTVIEEPDGSLRLHPPSGPAAEAGITDAITVRGWNISREADGSLILTRQRPADTATAPSSEPAPPPRPPLLEPAAQAHLESLGWQVERAEDGAVLLFPPGPVVPDEYAQHSPVDRPVAESPPVTDLAIMDEATLTALREGGWHVETAEDGSILLYPPRPEAAPAGEPPIMDEATRAALRERGWGVATADDGSILLSPPGAETTTPPTAEPATPEPAPSSPALTAGLSDDAVLDLLEQRGWTVERAPDGSLLLYPRGYREPPAAPSDAGLPGTCAGHTVAAVAEGRITPPLEGWGDVHAIAAAWIADSGMDGVAVGRIRQIFRVYVVSIVDAAPPNRLRHQLGIQRDSGEVILLD